MTDDERAALLAEFRKDWRDYEHDNKIALRKYQATENERNLRNDRIERRLAKA